MSGSALSYLVCSTSWPCTILFSSFSKYSFHLPTLDTGSIKICPSWSLIAFHIRLNSLYSLMTLKKFLVLPGVWSFSAICNKLLKNLSFSLWRVLLRFFRSCMKTSFVVWVLLLIKSSLAVYLTVLQTSLYQMFFWSF